jgi:hypothetical protein
MLYLRAVRANGSNTGESPSSTMQLFGYGCIPVGAASPLLVLIHPSSWKGPKLEVVPAERSERYFLPPRKTTRTV